MANWALTISKRALERHGVDAKYTVTTRVVNENEGTVAETPTDYILRVYPRQIQANQYNYPTLVGKKLVMFYLALDSLPFNPSVSDRIEYLGEVYRMYQYQGHTAQGQVVLHRILGVKG